MKTQKNKTKTVGDDIDQKVKAFLELEKCLVECKNPKAEAVIISCAMQEEYVARCVKENLAEIFKARKEKLK
jgi:hypothetical protein